MTGVARQLGTAWTTVWGSIRPILEAAAAEESRFVGVTTLGVDEHIVHHVSPVKRGPKELTGMVDLTRDKDGRTRARLLDLVPGRSGTVYADWLKARGDTFRNRVQVVTLDPFRGYKNAIDDQLADATAVLDAFHVVKLATQAVDEVRRRVQQDIHGHRGRKDDPLYRIRNILRSGQEHLTERHQNRLAETIAADERHDEVHVAWQCAQRFRGRLSRRHPNRGQSPGRNDPVQLPPLPDPRDRPPRQNPETVARRVPGLLRHRRRQQRRHRSHQRPDRTPPPHRPRL